MKEVDLPPLKLTSRRAVGGVISIWLRALRMADVLDLVDGTETAVTGLATSDEACHDRGEGCDASHLELLVLSGATNEGG